MKKKPLTDPIVEETRRWREEIQEETGYDLGRLTQRLMKSQKRHGDKLVNLAQEDQLDLEAYYEAKREMAESGEKPIPYEEFRKELGL